MDAPITYHDLLDAVDIAHRCINHHGTVTVDTWERILPTLIAAHALCVGPTRTLIRQLFTATYHDTNDLAAILHEVHHRLRPHRVLSRGISEA